MVQATESRTKAYGPGRLGGGGWVGGGGEGSAPNFSKIWYFPGKKLMTRKTAVELKNSNNNKNNDNNNNTNDCHSQTSGYMNTCQIQACSVNRWRELVDYAPIPLNRRRGRGGGVGEGRVCGGDLTFFKNFAVKFLPTGKSFQSIATKFPHPGLHIAVHPKAGPKKGTIKIYPNKTLKSLFILRCCITKDTCSCYSCNYTF